MEGDWLTGSLSTEDGQLGHSGALGEGVGALICDGLTVSAVDYPSTFNSNCELVRYYLIFRPP